MSSQPSTSIRAVQAATILASTAAGAGNLSLSLFVIPRILESPTPLMLRQWHNMFRRTSLVFPPPIILSGFAYFFLAYASRGVPGRARWYALAGALCSSVSPWTWTFLIPINKKLLRKADDARDMGILAAGMDALEEESSKMLVDDWATFNLPRGVAVLLAGMIGLCATIL
jgi:hypothetical protein